MSIRRVSSENKSKKEIKRKLKIEEYTLEIGGNDIFNTNVIYSFNTIESTIYNDGKKAETIIEPIITIELNGEDSDGNNAWICFDLKLDVDYLNTLSKKPTDITCFLSEGESFIKKPSEKLSFFLDFDLPKHTEEDIYKNLTSLWISKLSENEFIMKLSVPNEVFTYFKIIFNK